MYRNWTSLIKPSRVEFIGGEDPKRKATVIIEPLERGFGTTIGHALRRVLISSLEGSAISAVEIEGVSHEATSISGVQEDVADILLNLKGVVIRQASNEPQIISLMSDQVGVVTAGAITGGNGIQIMNPDHPIATINAGGRLSMVMTVTTGKGYVPAVPDTQSASHAIPLDCSFNPVKSVSCHVSNARIGQQTDYDKLALEIETNGVLSPEEAVELAAKILREQLGVFVNFVEELPVQEPVADNSEWFPGLFVKIDDLEFSVRASKVLRETGAVYVGDLVQMDPKSLLKMPNFGRKSLDEVNAVLTGMGLELGLKLERWPPEDIERRSRMIDAHDYT
ncbi:MAG: DNA-directed RNA polymerase subunit alpha [Magnetococcales bacterium]|nr:DNA-directed RNA polymerase subunit alpha [Magnetococcales bacterium]